MKNPYLSIIIPVYNGEKFIKRCLESITNQTFKDFEIIVINDGSNDNTLSILREYSSVDKRLKIISSDNLGQSSARNLGLKNSKGTVIGFIDSDDWIDKEMYSILVKNLKDTHSDISECSYYLAKNINSKHKHNDNTYEIFTENLPYKLIVSGLKNRISSYSVCNKIYLKEILTGINFYEKSYSEDYLFNFSVYSKANRVVSSQFIGYSYFQREDSTISNKLSDNDFYHVETSKIVYEKSKLMNDCDLVLKSEERIIRVYFNLLLKKNIYGYDNKIENEKIYFLVKNYKKNIGILLKSKDMRLNRKILAIGLYVIVSVKPI